MQTNPLSTTYTPVIPGAAKDPSSKLDKDGFLKMLTEQIRNQDPTSGQDPTQYFQTISQMSVVEQLTNLAAQSADQLAASKTSSAQSLLGRTVSYLGKDGLSVTGIVERVDLAGATPRITVGGIHGIDPAILTEVK